MNISRVWTIILRIFYASRRDLNKLFDFTYWPLLDIFLFGLIGVWLNTDQNDHVILSLMGGLVLWQVAFRTNLEISRSLLDEQTDKNLTNLLTTPLRPTEWIAGLMLTGLISIAFTIPFGTLMVKLIYGVNIFSLGWPLLLFAFLLTISGWTLGLIGAGFLIRWGHRVATMVWAIGWLPAPFCTVYYPVSVLPLWAQSISKCLPMTYTFEAMRSVIYTGTLPLNSVYISLILNIFYFTLAALFFRYMFNIRKNMGFESM